MTPPTMPAYRLTGWQQPAELVEVPVPQPGPGQVRIRVAGVGLCHSDLLFLDTAAGLLPYTLPFTLGHEIAGWVDACGPGADGLEPGEPVAVACVSACWNCRWCRQGAENYCVNSWQGRGYGRDGGLAGFVLAGRREVLALGGIDPVAAAPLTDAGATSYHAVRRVLDRLRPGTQAVVIGVGGLGGYALQWLRLLSPARVVAVDTEPHRLERAVRLGAHATVTGGEGFGRRLAEALGGSGADVVLDFVGTDATMRAALRVAAVRGAVGIVGQGFGSVELRWGAVAHDCDVFIPQGSTVRELGEVLRLAADGGVVSDVTTFGLHEAGEAYAQLRAGTLTGRAVVIPPA